MEAAVVAFLAPFLPYLVNAGRRAAEDAIEGLGAHAWEYAQTLWGKLHPGLAKRPAADEAVRDAAADPNDEAALGALQMQLRKIFTEDPALAQEVADLMRDAEAAGVSTVTIQGNATVKASRGGVANIGPITGGVHVGNDPKER
jgi:hypothetical protein